MYLTESVNDLKGVKTMTIKRQIEKLINENPQGLSWFEVRKAIYGHCIGCLPGQRAAITRTLRTLEREQIINRGVDQEFKSIYKPVL